jgi:uncharacterized protein (UPF0297 family)
MAKRKNSTNSQSLSCQETTMEEKSSSKMSKKQIEDLQKKVFDSINNLELQKSLDKWLKENENNNSVSKRDFALLKGIISEYMDCYLLFGYNINGDRVIIQNFNKPRDRDAIMEFLKTIFLKQQHENFLDE